MTRIPASATPGPRPVEVLVVDDDDLVRKAWRAMLGTSEFRVQVCATGVEAVQVLAAERFDVVVTDVKMPGGISGLQLLERIKRTQAELEVILMTGDGSIPDAVKATKIGAFDYITKPFHEMEDCINKVRQAARLKRLHDENQELRRQVEAAPNSALLASASPTMKPVLDQINRVARVTSNVLITGSTGAGKSVIARAIHDRSRRASGPFVHVDCGAIPAELIESELFGHIKGSFTGAVSNKEGLFEVASGGTILLDEIGNMALTMQQRLLRVLQEDVVRRVGGAQDIHIDVRVISATHRDLPQLIAQKLFREDLYFRLKVVEIRLPDLSDRPEDIPRLAYHFLQQHGRRMGRHFKGITPRCMDALKAHAWKGNVRELANVIEAAMVFETGEELSEHALPDELVHQVDGAQEPVALALVDLDLPLREAIDNAETAFRVTYLRGLMERFRNVSAAARHAQVDRANFRRLLKRYDITDYPKGQVS